RHAARTRRLGLAAGARLAHRAFAAGRLLRRRAWRTAPCRGGTMRVALVNPRWTFERSIYFGCRAPHLPLELGYARALLERNGHAVLMLDGHLFGQEMAEVAAEVVAFRPDMTVIPTAPSYLFWRCAPPELRVPRAMLSALDGRGGTTVAVGPHGSATPGATLRKLGVDIVVRGEAEEIVAALASGAAAEAVLGTAVLRD